MIKFSPRITEKGCPISWLIKGSKPNFYVLCNQYMKCYHSTKNRENQGFRISWPPYIGGRFSVTDALKSFRLLFCCALTYTGNYRNKFQINVAICVAVILNFKYGAKNYGDWDGRKNSNILGTSDLEPRVVK